MAQVVQRYTRTLKPDDLASEQRPRVRQLLEAKLAGGSIIDTDEQTPEPEPVAPADLALALKATLKAAPRKRRAVAAAR
jgi:non-homologous end joining protein Ku